MDKKYNYTVSNMANYSDDIEANSPYKITEANYGKGSVKLLHVTREGKMHSIRELEVDTRLSLNTKTDYITGNNQAIIATDSQKNIVHVMAKKYGVKTPEQFALLLCNFFLQKYPHVDKAAVTVIEYPWQRMNAQGKPHNHAFVMVPTAERHTTVTQLRGASPVVSSGLRGLRVLKTTQSAFVDFVNDEFRTLPDAEDRICSTSVTANWTYSNVENLDFNQAWMTVRDSILEMFAGGPENGIYSPSVQNTLYEAERLSLDRIPNIASMEMLLPNKHYLDMDMSRFPKELVGEGRNTTVYFPIDKPSGMIYAQLSRKDKSKL